MAKVPHTETICIIQRWQQFASINLALQLEKKKNKTLAFSLFAP